MPLYKLIGSVSYSHFFINISSSRMTAYVAFYALFVVVLAHVAIGGAAEWIH